eukprot:5398279-Pyramimonas_sp.AAC.1
MSAPGFALNRKVSLSGASAPDGRVLGEPPERPRELTCLRAPVFQKKPLDGTAAAPYLRRFLPDVPADLHFPPPPRSMLRRAVRAARPSAPGRSF